MLLLGQHQKCYGFGQWYQHLTGRLLWGKMDLAFLFGRRDLWMRLKMSSTVLVRQIHQHESL